MVQTEEEEVAPVYAQNGCNEKNGYWTANMAAPVGMLYGPIKWKSETFLPMLIE